MKKPENIIESQIGKEWCKDPTINTNATIFRLDFVINCINEAFKENNKIGNSYQIVEKYENTKPNSTSRYSREFIYKCINDVYIK